MTRRTIPGAATVSEHMTSSDIDTLDVNQTLDVADDLFAMRRIRHLPVLEHGKVVGVVSERDLFRAALAEAVARRHGPDDAMSRIPVAAVMSAPAVTVDPRADMAAAICLMLDKRIGCLPVVEAGTLVGLLTTTDVMRYATGRTRG